MRTFTMIFSGLLVICGLASAQYNVDAVAVHFTTAVVVGETTLPAGNCKIQIMRGNGDTVSLVFRSESGLTTTALVNRLHQSEDPSGIGTRVVLRRIGNESRIDRLVMADGTGFQLLRDE